MSEKASSVVLNFKMNGQVQYAQTLKQINMVMQTASKEYSSQITAMGKDADATQKLLAEKKKLDTQLTASSQKVEMLSKEFEDMQNDTSATADDLQKLYNQLLSAETAHSKLENAMQRVNDGLSEEGKATREAKEELGDLSKEMQRLEAEQKSLTSSFQLQNAELDENADEVLKTALAQRQLAQQMQLTDRVVSTLEKQLDQAKKAYGENSKEVYQLEAKLNQAKSTVRKFGEELEGVEDSAEQAERGLDGVEGALTALAGMIPTAAIAGLVDSTQELATEMARLKSNAEAWGFTAEVVEDSFAKLTAVTGDSGAAVETISNLMSTNFSDEQLSEALDHITGAYIQFSDTLSAEGIADGLQETFAVGEAAGSFAELLERSGIVLDDFNKDLAVAIENGTETDFVLQTLANTGVKDFYEAYREANPELVKAQEAQVAQQIALKELGDVFRPVITDVTEFTTKLIEWALENDKLVLGIGIASVAIGGIVTVLALLSPILTAVMAVIGPMGLSLGAIAAPIGIAVVAIGLLGAALVAAYNHSETFRDGVQTIFEAIETTIRTIIEVVVTYLQEKLSQILQFWDENGAQILQAVENCFDGIKAAFEFLLPFLKAILEDFISAAKNVIDGGLNFILGLVKTFASLFTGDWEGVWEGLKQMFSGAVEALWGILQLGFMGKILKIVKGFGGDALKVVTDMVSNMKGKFDELVSAGKSKFDSLKEKIMTPVNAARDAVKAAIDKIKSFFDFEWSLPKLKLPKINIKGDFSLNPPSVPSFGIDWFAKGGIMTRPTAFGINGNNIMAGGEAGPEAILPLNEKTLGEIGKAIASTIGGQNVNIAPAPIILDSRVIGEAIFNVISNKQYSAASIAAMTRGVHVK